MADFAGLIAAAAAVLLGIAGTIVPALPGLPLVWLGILVCAVATGFEAVGTEFVIVTLIVTFATEAADYYAKAYAARRFGAGRAGAWGAAIGAVAGLFFFPIGLLIGPFAGAAVAELWTGQSLADAVRAGLGGVVGTLGFIPVKFAIAVVMGIALLIRVL